MKRMSLFLLFCLFFVLPFSLSGQETAEMQELSEMAADPGTVVSISPSACIPYDQSYWDYFNFYADPDRAYFDYNLGAFMVGFTAPVYLPHGATVTKMVVYFTDNADAGEDDTMDVTLYRHRMATGACNSLAVTDSTPYANSPNRRTMRDRSIDYPIIDNQFFSYYLVVRFWQGREELQFHGAKIFYELIL